MKNIDIYIQEKKTEFEKLSAQLDISRTTTEAIKNEFIDSLIRQTARETVEDLVPEKYNHSLTNNKNHSKDEIYCCIECH